MARIAAKATKGKGKRWIKGQSSSSNPTTNRFRNKAMQVLSGTGPGIEDVSTPNSKNKLKLTKDLLDKYDAMQQQKLRQASSGGGIDEWLNQASKENEDSQDEDCVKVSNEDAVSVGNLSVASIWSNCTNITFDKFLNGFDSKSKIHKSMLTVLATIRDAIASQQGSETETEYFAALMMALNCVQSEDKLTATMALIQMVLRRVPREVLNLKFAETSRAFLRILGENSNSANPNGYLLKSVISSLGILLQNQELAVWQLDSTQRIFDTLLSLVLHLKPRVRKAASFTVISLVRNLTPAQTNNKGAEIARKLTAEFCIRKLQEHYTTTVDEHLNILLYILSLLSDTMVYCPTVQLTKLTCDAILTHMKLGNILVVTGALQTFYSFFARKPERNVLTPELNGQLLNFLYDYQPNLNDEQPLNAWFTTLKEGLLCLHRLDSSLCHLHLPKFVQTSIFCLQSDSHLVHSCVCNSIKVIHTMIVCNGGAMAIILKEPSTSTSTSNGELSDELLSRFYSELENSLKYKYSHAWIHVIPMLSELFIENRAAQSSIGSIMARLSILHESNDNELNEAIDHFFRKAVRFYGPRRILEQCPIRWKTIESFIPQKMDDNIDDRDEEFRGEFTNAWLLPILRDEIVDHSELSLFVDHFLPMADELSRKAQTCQRLATKLKHALSDLMETDQQFSSSFNAHESCLVASKELKRCVHAVWSLLPSFCRNPIDIPAVFSKIAKRFGEVLYDREFCQYSLAALRNLLKCPTEVCSEVGRFAKNYIPILFNIYTNENENSQIEFGLRIPVFVLVQQFLPLLFTDPKSMKMFQTFYQQIRNRLEEMNCTEYRRNALLDLVRAFLASPQGFELSQIEELYEKLTKPLIGGNSPAEQKKGFKMLEEIIESSSDACVEFIKKTIVEQIEFLFGIVGVGGSLRSSSTKAFALRSMRKLVEKYFLNPNQRIDGMVDWQNYLERLLPIVFDNLLLKSSKAQKTAHDTLLVLVDSFELMMKDSGNGNKFRLIGLIIDPLRIELDKLSLNERLSRSMAINYLYAERFHYPLVPKDVECNIADVVLSQLSLSTTSSSNGSEVSPLTRPILDVCFEFIKHFFNNAPADSLNCYLELITCNITNLPQQHRLKYRMKIRSMLIKLTRKFGFDFISSMIPEDYRKVLKNIRKFEERKKKQKQMEANGEDEEEESGIESDTKSRRSRKSSRNKKKYNDFSDDDEAEVERFVEGGNWSGDDSDDNDKEAASFKAKSKFDIMSRISAKSSKNFIREDADSDPIDLLSMSANRNVFSRVPKKFKLEAQQGVSGATKEGDDTKKKLPVNQDGRLVISELLDQIEGNTEETSNRKRATKRSAPGDEDDSDDDDDSDDGATVRSGKTTGTGYRPGGRGIHRAMSVSGQSAVSSRSMVSRKSGKSIGGRKRRGGGGRDGESSINRGEAYSSKNATGDMKRRGMPDPYAYYPLNPMQLNRRKAMKFKGEFNSMVKGAKKGTAAGLHLRNKRRKTSK